MIIQSNSAVDSFILKAVAGDADLPAKYALSSASGLPVPAFCNAVAMAVATRFNSGLISFDEGDAVMNEVSGLMFHHLNALPGNTLELPEPAWSIYLAFDAGEYHHGDGADPVAKYTVPMVKRLIGEG